MSDGKGEEWDASYTVFVLEIFCDTDKSATEVIYFANINLF